MRRAWRLFLLLVFLLLSPWVAQATVFYDEDWEGIDLNTQAATGPWFVQGGNPEILQPMPGRIDVVTDFCHSGSKCLRMRYDSLTTGEGPFAFRGFPSTFHVFVRAWVRMPLDFTPSNISTKMIYGPRTNIGHPNCVFLLIGNSRPFLDCQSDFSPTSFYVAGTVDPLTQVSIAPSIKDNQWHCMQAEIYLGTPGQSDGYMRYSQDNVLIGETSGIRINGGFPFITLYFYRERGLGDLFYDDVAVGDEALGCGTGGAPNPPPSTPTGFRVSWWLDLWDRLLDAGVWLMSWLGPSEAVAAELTNGRVIGSWNDPGDPSLQIQLRAWHFAVPGWIDLGLHPTRPPQFVHTFPPLALTDANGQPLADRPYCMDARYDRAGVAGLWLSQTPGGAACNQIALASLPPSEPLPIPEPPAPPASPPSLEARLASLAARVDELLARQGATAQDAASALAQLTAIKKAVCDLKTASTMRTALRTALGATGCAK